MNAPNLEQLAAELAKLKRRLEEPEVDLAFGISHYNGGPRLTITVKNTGVLPVHNLGVLARQGQAAHEFQLGEAPPWPLLPGESRKFWAGPQAVALLQAGPPNVVVVKSGEKELKEFPAVDLVNLLQQL